MFRLFNRGSGRGSELDAFEGHVALRPTSRLVKMLCGSGEPMEAPRPAIDRFRCAENLRRPSKASTKKRFRVCEIADISFLFLVGERGFEPPTPWSRTRCSTRLSHSPTEPPQERSGVPNLDSIAFCGW